MSRKYGIEGLILVAGWTAITVFFFRDEIEFLVTSLEPYALWLLLGAMIALMSPFVVITVMFYRDQRKQKHLEEKKVEK